MQFTYTYLKNAYENGTRLGNWKGSPVYSIPKRKLDCVDDGEAYFIIYDDDNALVKGGRNYGRVTGNGDVQELARPVDYWKKEEKKKKEEEKVEDYKSSIPEVTTGEIEIDAYISKMRALTIDEMVADVRS